VIEITAGKDPLTQLKTFKKSKWRKNSFKTQLKIKIDLTRKLNFCSKTNKRKSSRTICKRKRNSKLKSFSPQRSKSLNKKKH